MLANKLIFCVDINECKEQSPCEQECNNTIGSFSCFCRNGYSLDDNDRNCSGRAASLVITDSYTTDIDECEIGHCEQECRNFNGSFECSCMNGFTLNQDNISCDKGSYKNYTKIQYYLAIVASNAVGISLGVVFGVLVLVGLGLMIILVVLCRRRAIKKKRYGFNN